MTLNQQHIDGLVRTKLGRREKDNIAMKQNKIDEIKLIERIVLGGWRSEHRTVNQIDKFSDQSLVWSPPLWNT